MRKFGLGLIVLLLFFDVATAISQNQITQTSTGGQRIKDISSNLSQLRGLRLDEVYRLTLAADVPDNSRPSRVHLKKEPGHVFIILEKVDTVSGSKGAVVWGFYPNRPITSLVFRTVKSVLRDNSNREYDATITRNISCEELDKVIERVRELSLRKYNINRYNCYDYAIDIFNSVELQNPISYRHVKFPLIFGRGGSPCALYAQLIEMCSMKLALDNRIEISAGKAPATAGYDVNNRPATVQR